MRPTVSRSESGAHVRCDLPGVGRISISLVHLNAGWRYWARWTLDAEGYAGGFDDMDGLPADGYPSEEAAIEAATALLEEHAAANGQEVG